MNELAQELVEQTAITNMTTNKITMEQIIIAGLVGAMISIGALYINSFVPKMLGK